VPQLQLAEALVENSCMDKVFICNSGAEANEGAVKLARKYGKLHRNGSYEVITTWNSFHGRTLAMTAATGKPHDEDPFQPLPSGFVAVDYDSIDAIKAATTDRTAAVMLEPVQGEGGVNVPSNDYFTQVREWCDENGLLLIMDEVQTGLGRLGTLFGYQSFDVEPDVMTLAKSLCGGIAGGAMLTTAEIAPSLRPGMHAATFGGNPIASAAGVASLEMIERENLLENVSRLADHFRSCFQDLANRCAWVREVRVVGMMVGIELDVDGNQVVEKCMQEKLLLNCTQGNVIRLLPAMNLTADEARQGSEILCQVLESLQP